MPTYVSEVNELISEWDFSKNEVLGYDPNKISVHSSKKVFWKCVNCGYVWPAIVSNRSKGHGCKECGIKKREESKIRNRIAKTGSLEDWCLNNGPWGMILLTQWDCKANGDKRPSMFTAKSSELIFWKCEKGHEWPEKIQNRVLKKYGCPFCSNRRIIAGENDFETLFPDIAAEWNYSKNGDVSPKDITYGTDKDYWWICKKGHEWKDSPNDRTSKGSGCPYCNHKRVVENETSLAAKYPELIKDWNYNKNEVNPKKIFPYSQEEAWWKCSVCGHEWKQNIANRVQGGICPQCSKRTHTSFPEQALYFYLNKVYSDVQIHYTDIFDNKMEIDIFIPSIAVGIEYDGAAWHNSKQAEKREKEKYDICTRNGIKLFRIKEVVTDEYKHYCDVMLKIDKPSRHIENIDSVLDQLSKYIRIPEHNCERDEYIIRRNYYSVAWKNCLAVKRPNLVDEWDYEKNNGLTPDMFFQSSGDRVWWKCEKGHEWKAEIYSRAKGHGCKYCKNMKVWNGDNDLLTRYPGIAQTWNYEKNNTSPSEIVFSSSKKVWWKCNKCGYEWPAIVRDRTIVGTGCPVCCNNVVKKGYNDFATEHPELLPQWDYERNGDLRPNMFVSGSTQRIWWKCENGHSWPAEIRMRVRGNGCRYCSGKGKKILNIETGEIFEGPYAVAKKYGCSYSAITNCCTGKTKTSCGYHWKYLDE